jgi:hypothetical protein
MNEKIRDSLAVLVVVSIIAFICGVIGLRAEYQQTKLLKQIAVEKGIAWYNPTNGYFEILTNK